MTDYTLFLDLAKEVQPPDKGILSRTLFSDDRLKAVAFGFAQGEELSEHTASMPAVQGNCGIVGVPDAAPDVDARIAPHRAPAPALRLRVAGQGSSVPWRMV